MLDGWGKEHDALVFANDAWFGNHFDIDVIKEETVDEDGEFFELDNIGDDELTEVFDLFVVDVFFDVFNRFAGRFVRGDWVFVIDIGVDENFGVEAGSEVIWEFGFEEVFMAEHNAVGRSGWSVKSHAGELFAEDFVDLHEVHAVWSGIRKVAGYGGNWTDKADFFVFLHGGEHLGDGIFGDNAVGVEEEDVASGSEFEDFVGFAVDDGDETVPFLGDFIEVGLSFGVGMIIDKIDGTEEIEIGVADEGVNAEFEPV